MATTVVQCARCGATAAPDARFCGNCGAAVSASAEVAEDLLLARLRQATQGEYEVLGELGRGGMAAVYLAWDRDLARHVAIKVLLPELAHHPGMSPRFLQEARTAANLDDHPSVVRVYRAKEADGLRFFVMKFVDGCSLEQLLRATGPLPPELAAHVVDQVAQALQYAHEHGVVHRDVKPGNILLDRQGNVVVTDFGIAKVAEAESLTRTGLAIGTPHYMSPEQWRVEPLSPSSDQYALGVVAHHAVAGEVPFDGTQYEIQEGHLRLDPRPLSAGRPEVPPGLDAVVSVMLAKRPDERFPDLHSVSRALAAVPRETPSVLRAQLAARVAAAAPGGAPVRTPAGVAPLRLTPQPVTPPAGMPSVATPAAPTPAAPTPAASTATPAPAVAAPLTPPTPAPALAPVAFPPPPAGGVPATATAALAPPAPPPPAAPVPSTPRMTPAEPFAPEAGAAGSAENASAERVSAVNVSAERATPAAPDRVADVAPDAAFEATPAVVTGADDPAPAPRRRSKAPALAAVGVLVAVGAGWAVTRARGADTPAAPVQNAAASAPAAPAPTPAPPPVPDSAALAAAAAAAAADSLRADSVAFAAAAAAAPPPPAPTAAAAAGPRVATSILVAGAPPSGAAALTVGDSVRVVARVNDQRGARMADATVQWTSSDPSRVVRRGSWVVALAPGGPVDITAASGPVRRAALRVTVAPRAAAAAPVAAAAAGPTDADVQQAVQGFVATLRSRDADAIGRRLGNDAASREFVEWVRGGGKRYGVDAPSAGKVSTEGGVPRVAVRVPIRVGRGGLIGSSARRDATFYLTLSRDGDGWHAGQAVLASRFTPP